MLDNYVKLGIYAFLAALVVLVMLLSYFLGERHKSKAKDEVYESGIKIMPLKNKAFPVHFYLMALFFVVFDLESMFLLSYSLVAKKLGAQGFIYLFFFVFFLLLSIFYLYRTGGFNIEKNQQNKGGIQ